MFHPKNDVLRSMSIQNVSKTTKVKKLNFI